MVLLSPSGASKLHYVDSLLPLASSSLNGILARLLTFQQHSLILFFKASILFI